MPRNLLGMSSLRTVFRGFCLSGAALFVTGTVAVPSAAQDAAAQDAAAQDVAAQDVAAAVSQRQQGNYRPTVGEPHPDFTLPRIDNREPVSLRDFRGKKVLLIHFASW